eukprot:TRINITY_DN4620_c0_g1_i7.p1 TRINITY_DN4620_c0_g1~~TRINITY_DN4620_c0_g1_i7.p1  ORF type:complete len:446 (+),score=73.53 TRINITY_DN4620_c0_g1_i7:44-1381(+)
MNPPTAHKVKQTLLPRKMRSKKPESKENAAPRKKRRMRKKAEVGNEANAPVHLGKEISPTRSVMSMQSTPTMACIGNPAQKLKDQEDASSHDREDEEEYNDHVHQLSPENSQATFQATTNAIDIDDSEGDTDSMESAPVLRKTVAPFIAPYKIALRWISIDGEPVHCSRRWYVVFQDNFLSINADEKETFKYSEVRMIRAYDECQITLLSIVCQTRGRQLFGDTFDLNHAEKKTVRILLGIQDPDDFRAKLPALDCLLEEYNKEIKLSPIIRSVYDLISVVDQNTWARMDNIEHESILGMDNSLLLFSYSAGPGESVRIHAQEYKSLEKDTYVIDNIINFIFLYRKSKLMRKWQTNVKVFNTFFYTMNLADTNRRKAAISKWPSLVDASFFQTVLIIIPVHFDVHWTLVCVCNPWKIIPGMYSGIVFFDSLEDSGWVATHVCVKR